VDQFDRDRHCFSATNAERRDALVQPAQLQRSHQRGDDPRTARADRMAEREEAITDGSAALKDVRLTAFTLAGASNWPARWFRPKGLMSAQQVAYDIVELLCSGLRPIR
jgi:hypothetical protein